MTTIRPDDGVPSTPIFDETIGTPTYGDLRTPPPRGEEDLAARPDADAPSSATDRAKQTGGAAKDAAADVAGTAKDAGARVASTGKEQASRVAKDAIGQARELYGQATSQLSEQAGTQQQKAAGTLHAFADDLGSMGSSAEGGLASELVQNLETRARGVADWLQQRTPEDVLDEVKDFAARRPGLFIALAAGTGIVAARLTKALVAEAKADDAPATTTPTAAPTNPIAPDLR
ncbi:hypothetical protein [Amnibacterium kyonggiense]